MKKTTLQANMKCFNHFKDWFIFANLLIRPDVCCISWKTNFPQNTWLLRFPAINSLHVFHARLVKPNMFRLEESGKHNMNNFFMLCKEHWLHLLLPKFHTNFVLFTVALLCVTTLTSDFIEFGFDLAYWISESIWTENPFKCFVALNV